MVLYITLCRNWLSQFLYLGKLSGAQKQHYSTPGGVRGEPEHWNEGKISCLYLDGFCVLIIQELLLLQLGDPGSGSTKSSSTNIFKRDVHKMNVKGGKQHYCLLVGI